VVQKSFFKVAPQPLFWRVVQKSFFKVAPPYQFHVLVKKPQQLVQIYLFFQGRIHFFQ
jgi:hypothetical protein